MGRFGEYFKMAIDSIRSNKGRTLLTMLGIIIGISSVIMITTIGNGLQGSIKDLYGSVGNVMYVWPGEDAETSPEAITEIDMEEIRALNGITGVTPTDAVSGKLETRKGKFDASISVGNPDLEYTNRLDIIYGNFFSDSQSDSGSMVCVIPEDDAQKLFGAKKVVGQKLEVEVAGGLQEVEIIGVSKSRTTSGIMAMMMGTTDKVTLYMPMSAMGVWGYDFSYATQIYISAEEGVEASYMEEETMNILNRNHGFTNEKMFETYTAAGEQDQMTSMFSMITVFITVVAAIALLVGGIGIMNIMLVSVTERTREIGIRKSLGARTTSIMVQFLSESAIIAGIGGGIGIVAGVVLGLIVCGILHMTAVIPWSAALWATLFACGIGLFFGIYPARKAAKLSPIEALRRE
ncbi:MAG: ABC transporter permease [Hespellia sp.]|nr:ABC transporter permease [Hespellia sp.]